MNAKSLISSQRMLWFKACRDHANNYCLCLHHQSTSSCQIRSQHQCCYRLPTVVQALQTSNSTDDQKQQQEEWEYDWDEFFKMWWYDGKWHEVRCESYIAEKSPVHVNLKTIKTECLQHCNGQLLRLALMSECRCGDATLPLLSLLYSTYQVWITLPLCAFLITLLSSPPCYVPLVFLHLDAVIETEQLGISVTPHPSSLIELRYNNEQMTQGCSLLVPRYTHANIY